MKIQNTKSMKIKNNAMKLFAMAILLTATVFTGAASAQTTANISRSTGMFGITQNQTARLSVVRDDPFFRDDPFLRVELSFVDGEGNILSQKVYDLGAGKAAFWDLKGRDVVGRSGNRAQIRAILRFIGTPDTRQVENCIPTLEVIDNQSGETRFLLPAVQKVQISTVE